MADKKNNAPAGSESGSQAEASVDQAVIAHAVATGADGKEAKKAVTGEGDGKSGTVRGTVLHPILHNTDHLVPGDEVTLPRRDAEELIAVGHLIEGVGKDAKDALERADKARAAAVAPV